MTNKNNGSAKVDNGNVTVGNGNVTVDKGGATVDKGGATEGKGGATEGKGSAKVGNGGAAVDKGIAKENKDYPLKEFYKKIYGRYDLVNRIFTFGQDRNWRKKAVEECLENAPQQVLDICTGTGDLVLEMAEKAVRTGDPTFENSANKVVQRKDRSAKDPSEKVAQRKDRSAKDPSENAAQAVGPEVTDDSANVSATNSSPIHLTGYDFSAEMLEKAREKAAAAGAPIDFIEGNVAEMPFADNRFDTAGITFGIRNLIYENSNADRHLAEIHRVLRMNGRLVVLESSRPDNPVWRFINGIYLQFILPWLGGLISGNLKAYRYLAKSSKNYYSRKEMARILEQNGFRVIRSRPLFLGSVMLLVAEKLEKAEKLD